MFSTQIHLLNHPFMIDIFPILLFPRLRVPIKFSKMKIAQYLTHELSIFIEDVEILWLITVLHNWWHRYLKWADFQVRKATEKFWFSIFKGNLHIGLKEEFSLQLDFLCPKLIPNGIPAFIRLRLNLPPFFDGVAYRKVYKSVEFVDWDHWG